MSAPRLNRRFGVSGQDPGWHHRRRPRPARPARPDNARQQVVQGNLRWTAMARRRPIRPTRWPLAVLGLKVAWEKAQAAKGGGKPTTDDVAKAFKGIEYDSPSGRVKMALGGGPSGASRTPPTAPASLQQAEAAAGSRRHHPLPGGMREPAVRQDRGGVDQGRNAGARQVLSSDWRSTRC